FFSDFLFFVISAICCLVFVGAVPATFYRFFSGFLAEFGLFLLHLVGTKSELLLLAFWPAHLL
uniref:hypothetical protein n=1 Tax=Agathobacter rectalis TaxID=39491 RepID=UPI003FEEC535